MKRLVDEAHKYGSARSLGPNQLGGVITRLCSLRAWIRLNQGAEWRTVFAECLNLDKDIRSLYHSVSRSQGPYTVRFIQETTAEVYLNKYYTYRSVFSAWAWNLYHVAKIILHETIVDLLQLQIANVNTMSRAFAAEVMAQYSESLSELYEASSDIFASVPFYLNFHQKADHCAKPVNGLILMWNLYAAARLKIRAGLGREWSIQRLHFIGHSMGVRQATALANVLEKRAAWEAMECQETPECENLKARGIDETETRMQRYLTDLPPEPANERD